MAEVFFRQMRGNEFDVYSAGTKTYDMKEAGVDISSLFKDS